MSLAVQIRQHGGPEELQIVDVPVGEPGPGEIRIRHHAVGLNFIDVYHRTGLYPLNMPASIGMEAAGVVEAVGEGVTHLAPGDRAAYASNPPGSYCEARVMPAKTVCKLPDAISFETGAAMMLKGLTAQYLLKKTLPVEGLQPGDFVLFHAAAGGVGLIACQWAKALGLQLIGTAGSDAKCQLALANGAAHAINYRTEDFVEILKSEGGADLILDMVGGPYLPRNVKSLADDGRLVQIAFLQGPKVELNFAEMMMRRLTLTGSTLRPQSDLAKARIAAQVEANVWPMIARGAFRVVIDSEFPLSDAPAAHWRLESSGHVGKIVLKVEN